MNYALWLIQDRLFGLHSSTLPIHSSPIGKLITRNTSLRTESQERQKLRVKHSELVDCSEKQLSKRGARTSLLSLLPL